jgi:AcrR family transcriptional regulator
VVARSDTRQRIQDAARELFRAHGVTQVSLQQIAAELGITKPALYYHFASREVLVRSILEPLLAGVDGYLDELGTVASSDPRTVLEGYFDFHLQHRELLELAVREITTLSDLGLVDAVFAWRARVGDLLVGPTAPLADQVRATVALGGLADCVIVFAEVPDAELRVAAVAAACATLGIT